MRCKCKIILSNKIQIPNRNNQNSIDLGLGRNPKTTDGN